MKKLYDGFVRILPAWLARWMPGWTLVSFGLSSVTCLMVDLSVFSMVCVSLERGLGRQVAIAIAVTIARFVSGNCNFLWNMKYVFHSRFSKKAYLQYWALVLVNMALLTLSTQTVSSYFDVHGLWISLVKLGCEIVLFFFSYTMQKLFVFGNRWGQTPRKG